MRKMTSICGYGATGGGGVMKPPLVLLLLLVLYLASAAAGANAQITHPQEVSALRDIKHNLLDPNRNLTNWNHRVGDPCAFNWTGVLCFNQTMDDGYLHVRELQLLNMGLSGTLSPSVGLLSYMKILDLMWNNISGNIPTEIGNIKSLELLLLNGNQFTGSLPEEIGYLPQLDRMQIDQNFISGPIPKSFANLNKIKHLHMNNNSISGQIPPELSKLRSLVHLLLDNNNLSGNLPSQLAEIPNLLILSLRNCSLRGPVPDLSSIPNLAYIDLSYNQLQGFIPSNKLSEAITTIDLSYNILNGTIPANFSGLPRLQRLFISNNSLSGSIPSTIWEIWNSNGTGRLMLNLQNNMLSDISGNLNLPPNVTLWLQGNPICSKSNVAQFCGSQSPDVSINRIAKTTIDACPTQACPPPYEYAPQSPVPCFCAAPLIIGYRLKSPGFSEFLPYYNEFEVYLASGIKTKLYQLFIESFAWQNGPRLKMTLKIYPMYTDNNSHIFNRSEVIRIRGLFTRWKLPSSAIFGPYELLNFTLLDPYIDVIHTSSSPSLSKVATGVIVLGSVAGAVTLSAIVSCMILRLHKRKHHATSKRRKLSRVSMKIEGVEDFNYSEMALATNNFSSSMQVGHGGYGSVYRGTLADGRVVAIKRAEKGSLQGEKEFLTEIELLSRLHHRNLVSLIGYCDEEGEQMLVYEFMPNGTLRDHLSGMSSMSLNFAMRTSIVLGSAKGILYLHTEADPPIFHRDIKTSNILLDQKLTAKVADFGLSRLAPVPDKEGLLPEYISTVVKGTPGYLDPEYLLTHKLTDKSDVYSFGVVILELLTGMQPISHGKNIVREVNNAYRSGMIFSVIDKQMGSYPSECVENFVTLALDCCQEDTNARPSMAEVVRELENIWLMMPESDARTTYLSNSDPRNTLIAQSSSRQTENPYISTEVSGSDLVSGVIPTITAR